jgi:hypothetical protein
LIAGGDDHQSGARHEEGDQNGRGKHIDGDAQVAAALLDGDEQQNFRETGQQQARAET